MKIATFNVNGVNGRLPVLLRWLGEAAAGRRLPAGTQGAAGEVSRGGDPRRRLRRDLAWPEELERRRHPGARGEAHRNAARPARRSRRHCTAAISRRRSTACSSAASICRTAIRRPGRSSTTSCAGSSGWPPTPKTLLASSARPSCWPATTTSCRPSSTSTSPSAGSTMRCSARKCALPFEQLIEQGWTDALRDASSRTSAIYTFWDYFRNAYAAKRRPAHRPPAAQPGRRRTTWPAPRSIATCAAGTKASDHAPVWIELEEARKPGARRGRAGASAPKRRA